LNPHDYSSLDFESFQYSFKNGFIIKTWLKIDTLYYAKFPMFHYIFVLPVVKVLSKFINGFQINVCIFILNVSVFQ